MPRAFPQGLKPVGCCWLYVGAKAPTPTERTFSLSGEAVAWRCRAHIPKEAACVEEAG